MRLADLLERCRTDWRLVALLMVPNVAGIAFGYYYYFDTGQFDAASQHFQHPAWWPLVADSPNAVVVMSAVLILSLFGLRSRVLDSLAFILMAYVGIWTTFLFLSFPDQLGPFAWSRWPENANPLLFVSHLGMPLEALIVVPWLSKQRVAWPWVGAAAALAAAFVWVDYWGPHLHPAPGLLGHDATLRLGSPVLMAFTIGVWLMVVLPWRSQPMRGKKT